MDLQELKEILPHREGMLLVEEAEVCEDGKARGKYTVKGNEFFLRGHFPGNPVVPGVILCEMMGQTTCVLLEHEAKGKTPFFTGLDKVKFRNPVRPGDTFETEVEITRVREPFYFAKGSGRVNGKLCVSGEFSFALVAEPQE